MSIGGNAELCGKRGKPGMSASQDLQPGVLGVFSRAAGTYDRVGPRVFEHFGEKLVQRARLRPGAFVLDVAAGRGAVLFPAGQQVGLDGRVTAIDFSPEMVRRTAADIDASGMRNIEIQHMDAMHLNFPDASFDQVLCGFALWFFSDPRHVLREFLRVLKPGGQVGLSTWAEGGDFPSWCDGQVTAALPAQAPSSPPPQRFGNPFQLEAVLDGTGFSVGEIAEEEMTAVFADDEEWWRSLWAGGMRSRFERLDTQQLDQFKAEMLRRVAPFRREDGIHTRWRAWIALAKKP
jgi:ubiquinone/menaquinone biosynthesis C-methylase UbiE